ncbi:unnamed protein product, partial [Effrenium voratum]
MEGGPAQAWPPRKGSADELRPSKVEEHSARTATPSSSKDGLRDAASTLDRPSGTERLSGTDRHSGTDRPSIISSGTSNRSGGGGGGVNGLGVAKAGSVGSLGRAKSAAASASAKTIKTRCKVMMAPVKRLCSFIAEHKAYVFVGTFITVWALLGDDLKLLTTDKPADGLFDGLVVFCIVFFSSEVLICCLGKDDYFMSFFFVLDVGSTLTLFMDLTV